jgi:hypothetical protein
MFRSQRLGLSMLFNSVSGSALMRQVSGQQSKK